jgi:hypothetical protein
MGGNGGKIALVGRKIERFQFVGRGWKVLDRSDPSGSRRGFHRGNGRGFGGHSGSGFWGGRRSGRGFGRRFSSGRWGGRGRSGGWRCVLRVLLDLGFLFFLLPVLEGFFLFLRDDRQLGPDIVTEDLF